MSDREAIFGALRRVPRRGIAHPGRYTPPSSGASAERFREALAVAGGVCEGPFAANALREPVARRIAAWRAHGRIVAEPRAAAVLAGLAGLEIEVLGEDVTPASGADVALSVATGPLAVAENGAVAVTGADAPHRAHLVLCECLVLLVPAASIVPDLHAAFAALPPDALEHHHLTWIAGPSKTADIEQALVYGAHGPRELVVVLVGESAS